MTDRVVGKAVVVGGGLSGLSAGFRLLNGGWKVVVLEREDEPGGRCRSVESGGFLFDTGAQQFRDSYNQTLKTAVELRLGAELRMPAHAVGIYTKYGLGTFLPRKPSPTALFPWKVLGFAGLRDVAAVAVPLVRRYGDYDGRFPHRWAHGDDRPAKEYLSGRASTRFVEGFAGPVTGYTLGAELEVVSAGAFLAAMRLALADRCGCLTGGMGMLADALASKLEVKAGVEVEDVVVEGGRAVGVKARPTSGGRARRYSADLVICAVPAPILKGIAPSLGREVRGVIDGISYSPGIVVNMGFGMEISPPAGVVMLPGANGLQSCWLCTGAGRGAEAAPGGSTAVTVVFSGPRARELMESGDTEVVEAAVRETAGVADTGEGRPEECLVSRHPLGRPVPSPGHAARVRDARAAGSGIEGLVLAGDWMQTPTVEGAVSSGFLAAGQAPCFPAEKQAASGG